MTEHSGPVMKSNWQRLLENPSDKGILAIRSSLLTAIRSFFTQRCYLEFESPLLTPYPTLDNNIDSIVCRVRTPDGRLRTGYLHTSPEHAMKKVLSYGSGSLYYLGKVFRDNELTAFHNPEFTMAEWYKIPGQLDEILEETQELVCSIAETVFGTLHFKFGTSLCDLTPPWPRIPVPELFRHHYGISKAELRDPDILAACVRENRFHYNENDDWETLFHRLFMERIEPSLASEGPSFLVDYPVEVGLMAKQKEGDPGYVDRAELYIAGIEMANGYSELTDSEEQYRRFQAQAAVKHAAGFRDYSVDFELLESLKSLSPCAGMALGVDRLLMFLLNKSHIRDVILFPY